MLVAAGYVGVADVEGEGDAGGDGVDGAGVDGDGADGGYGVGRCLEAALAARVWRSTERMSSAAAVRASRRSGMRSAPAWPPKPVIS